MAYPYRIARPKTTPVPGPRTRVVQHQWLRDPNGPILPRPPPLGMRLKSGLIWGHSLEDFMWIQRVPGVDVLTIWSRSMIKELGENYDEREFSHPEPPPRRRRPWPVLRLRKGDRTWLDDPLGAIDEGCVHDDSNLRNYVIRGDPFEDDDDDDDGLPDVDLTQRRPLDAEDAEHFMPNTEGLMSPLGVPYVRLWLPELRTMFGKARDLGGLGKIVLVGHDPKTGLARAADEVGEVDVFVETPPPGTEPRQRVLIAIHPDKFAKMSQNPPQSQSDSSKPDARDVKSATVSVAIQNVTPGLSSVGNTTANIEIPAAELSTSLDKLDTTADVALTVGEDSGSQNTVPMDLDASAPPISPAAQLLDEQIIKEANMLVDDVRTQVNGESASKDSQDGCKTSPMDVDGEHSSPTERDAKNNSQVSQDGIAKDEDTASTSEVGGSDISADDVAKPQGDSSIPKSQDTTKNPAHSKGLVDDPHLYSVDDLPKLEEFIPEQFFPDYLMVHRSYSDDPTAKYKRIFPVLPRDSSPDAEPPRVAHLHLSDSNRLGVGNHSVVRRGALTLPPPLSARSRTKQVTVAAKTALNVVSARKFLRHEAAKYAAFPKYLQEEYCGYHLVSPIKHPVPVGAVVPKLYGYYVPVGDDGEPIDKTYADCSWEDGSRVHGPSPILLMEECGEPIKPETFTLDARSECYSLILRLHYEGFTQGSLYVRNVVVQPGPLTTAPENRSMKCPSYRIIDFGRAEHWKDYIDDSMNERRRKAKRHEWLQMVNGEEARAQRELDIPDWDF